MRDEYDRQEETGREMAEAEERYIHFNGHHVQDPPAHGDYCVDSCPYDTPEQAQERAERAACAEAREAEYANGGRPVTGGHEGYGPQPADEHDLYRARERVLEAEPGRRQQC